MDLTELVTYNCERKARRKLMWRRKLKIFQSWQNDESFLVRNLDTIFDESGDEIEKDTDSKKIAHLSTGNKIKKFRNNWRKNAGGIGFNSFNPEILQENYFDNSEYTYTPNLTCPVIINNCYVKLQDILLDTNTDSKSVGEGKISLNNINNYSLSPTSASRSVKKSKPEKDESLKDKTTQQNDNASKPIVTNKRRKSELQCNAAKIDSTIKIRPNVSLKEGTLQQDKKTKIDMDPKKCIADATIISNILKENIIKSHDKPVVITQERKTEVHYSEFEASNVIDPTSKDIPTNRNYTCNVSTKCYTQLCKTEVILTMLLQRQTYTQTNIPYLCDANLNLPSKEKKHIYLHLKNVGCINKLEQMLQIVYFIKQHCPNMRNSIFSMRMLEVHDCTDSEKYITLCTSVNEGISELSKLMPKSDLYAYMKYVLWVYERRRLK